MKRTFRIWVSLIVIIVVAAIIAISYYFIKQNSRKYEIAKIENYQYFTLKKNDTFGVIDKNQNIIIEPNYTDVKIPNPEKAIFLCYQGDDITIFNDQGQELFTEYEKVEPIKLKNIASKKTIKFMVFFYFFSVKCLTISFISLFENSKSFFTKPIKGRTPSSS